MSHDLKIISSRRAYEFQVDGLRLTMLSIPPAAQAIQRAFSFQAAAFGTPPPTFGPVPESTPPGLVLQTGVWAATSEQQPVPIRFIHFEPRRIVIDVAGPSRHIDDLFATVLEICNQVRAPDGSAVIGSPSQVRDFSEISARFDVAPDAWVPAPLKDILRQALGMEKATTGLTFLPTLTAQAVEPSEEYQGTIASNTRFLQFTLRAGSTPEDGLFYSGAPLDSDAHLAYLDKLERVLTSADVANARK